MYFNTTTVLTVGAVSDNGGTPTVHFANGSSSDVHPQAAEAAAALKPDSSAQFTFDGHGYVIGIEAAE